MGFSIVFIDMLKNMLPDFTHTKPAQQAIAFLRRIARKYDLCIIINLHSKEGDKNVYRLEGSKELWGMPRWMLLVLPIDTRDVNSLRVVTVAKNNGQPRPPAICFRVTSVMIPNDNGVMESQPKLELVGQYPFTPFVLGMLFANRFFDWDEASIERYKLQRVKPSSLPPNHPDNVAASPAFGIDPDEPITINNVTPGDCIRGIEEALAKWKKEKKKRLKDATDDDKKKPKDEKKPDDKPGDDPPKPADDPQSDDPPPAPK